MPNLLQFQDKMDHLFLSPKKNRSEAKMLIYKHIVFFTNIFKFINKIYFLFGNY